MLFICACLGGQGFVSAFDGRRKRVTTHSGPAGDTGKEGGVSARWLEVEQRGRVLGRGREGGGGV